MAQKKTVRRKSPASKSKGTGTSARPRKRRASVKKLKRSPLLPVAILVCAIFVIVGVIALSFDRTGRKASTPTGGTVSTSEQTTPGYDEILRQLKLIFFEHDLSKDVFTESQTNGIKRIEAVIPEKAVPDILKAVQNMMRVNFGAASSPENGLFSAVTDSYKLEILITADAATQGTPVVGNAFAKGQIALLIDDAGANLELADRLTKLKTPMALAVLPHLHQSKQTADLARSRGKEIFLHFPMEPLSYPATDPGEGAALLSMPELLIKGVTEKNVESVGKLDGCNNHMGSALTESDVKMAQVLEALRPYTTNFVDSNTSPKTVALEVCQKTEGFKCGLNRKFLDNENDHAYIKGKLYEAAELSRTQGIIVIGHLRPDTVTVLEQVIPELEAQGLTFVKVTSLMR